MRYRTKCFAILLFTTLFFISILIPTALAAGFEGKIKLEGEENFSLTASQMRLFDFENIAPGDVRTGTLQIENTTDMKMECRIASVMSYSENKRLFNAMKLRITSRDDTVLYDGPYGGRGSESLAAISVKPQKTKTLNVEVSFPSDMGNDYQAAEMDSIWSFEARVFAAKAPSDNSNKDNDNKGEQNKGDTSGDADKNNSPVVQNGDKGNGSGDSGKGSGAGSGAADKGSDKHKSGVKTGLDLTLSDSGLIIGFILVGLCFLAALVTSVRICAAKRKRKDEGDILPGSNRPEASKERRGH